MYKLLKSKRRGSALPLVMLVVAILLAVGTGLLSLGLNSRVFAVRMASQIAARSAADAGLTKAIYEMNEKLEVKPWDANSLPLAADQALPNCSALVNYTVTGDIITGYTIQSTGEYNRAEKTVQCALELHGPFDYSIFAVNDIKLRNSAVIDWYNFDEDDGTMKLATNSIAADAVTLKNSATINGDVFAAKQCLINPGNCLMYIW